MPCAKSAGRGGSLIKIIKNNTMQLNIKTIKKLDRENMYSSIGELYRQCEQVLKESNKIKIPTAYKNVKNIIISGMGGSIIGGHIIKSIFKEQIKIPIEMVNNYQLPGYINKNTLCIISSYSGSTEETISAFRQAKKSKAKIIIITSGGKLKQLAEKEKIPSYIFNASHNHCKEPRMGLGYSIFGQIILLNKAGIIKINKKDLPAVIKIIKKFDKKYNIKNTANNLAVKIAKKIYEEIPILISSEFLMGNAHTFGNQINENAKNLSSWMEIPEINHHLLEGLKYPKSNKKNVCFVFLQSKLFYRRNQLRYKITKKVLRKNKISFTQYEAQSKNKLLQSFEILVLGSYVSFYLAMLNKLNPSPVPHVDYFKREMKKISHL